MEFKEPIVVKVDFVVNVDLSARSMDDIRKTIEKHFIYFLYTGDNFYLSDFIFRSGSGISIDSPCNFIAKPDEILRLGTVTFI